MSQFASEHQYARIRSVSASQRAELDQDGNERPRFLLDYPRHAELDRLVAAFEVGDFRSVRQGARALSAGEAPAPVRQAARELFRRTRPDPLVLVLLATCFFLFAAVVGWTYFGPHAEARHGPSPAGRAAP